MIDAASYKKLHNDMKEADLFEAPTLRSWLKFGFCLSSAMVLMAAAWTIGGWGLLLLIPAGIALGVGVILGHEAGHGAACAKRWQNELLIHVGFGIMAGVSTNWWKYKHNVLHHNNPNVPGKDRDIILPPISISDAQYEAANPVRKWFNRHFQHLAIWPLTGLLGPLMRIRTFDYFISQVRTHGVDKKLVIDFAMVMLHYGVWLAPAAVFGWVPVLVNYFLVFGVVGVFLGYVFLMGHTGLPLATEWDDRWSLTVLTSRNVDMGPVGQWLTVGLDRQLEHHLFPAMSHYNIQKAAPYVRKWVEENGLEYYEQDTKTASLEVFNHFKVSWKDAARDLRGVTRLSA